jgi:hypothetical protein
MQMQIGGDEQDSRSYTGFVFKLAGAAVSWESRKQHTVALSSTEAEFMAVAEATKEAMYMKGFWEKCWGNRGHLCCTMTIRAPRNWHVTQFFTTGLSILTFVITLLVKL